MASWTKPPQACGHHVDQIALSYGDALDDLFRVLAARPLSRLPPLGVEGGSSQLSASTDNVRLAGSVSW